MSKLVIIPTVDVEGTHGERPFEQLVLGDVGANEPWGIEKIARTLNHYGAAGTFFMDVYEHSMWGTDVWERACADLCVFNQDVQLHTHPGWRDDKRDFQWIRDLKRERSFLSPDKDFMTKLSIDEQIELLQHGVDLLTKWTGQRPIAHRSGGYSVNEQTIDALAATGFKVDSSQNRGHSNSQLRWSYNAPVVHRDILQIPVTLYDRCFVSMGPRLKGTYRRLKTSTQSPGNELIHYGEIALAGGLPVMNLFMHSYSLLKMDKYFRNIDPDPVALQSLDSILAWGSQHPDVAIMPIAEYYQSGQWERTLCRGPKAPRCDFVPRISNPPGLISDLINKILYELA